MITSLKLPPDRFAQPQQHADEHIMETSAVELFQNALEQPIKYPPLTDLLFEGDKIVFVLLADLQSKERCVEGLLSYLLSFIQPCQIDLLSSQPIDLQEQKQQDWIQAFKLRDVDLAFVSHNKSDPQQNAYLAATHAAEPMYVNRLLFDADTIIPLTSAGCVDSDGRPKVYPEFSNSETLQRFEQLNPEQQRAEFRLAHESIGICYVINVTTDSSGQILDVQSGDCSQVAKNSGSTARPTMTIDRSTDAEVVVATIESPTKGQTWDHFFRALTTSAAASENARLIVVCTNLRELPENLHLQMLDLPFEPDHDAIQKILALIPEDFRAVPGIFEEATIYLKSDLTEEQVEELGLGFIASESELQRIVDNAQSGLFLRNAHLCKISDAAV